MSMCSNAVSRQDGAGEHNDIRIRSIFGSNNGETQKARHVVESLFFSRYPYAAILLQRLVPKLYIRCKNTLAPLRRFVGDISWEIELN